MLEHGPRDSKMTTYGTPRGKSTHRARAIPDVMVHPPPASPDSVASADEPRPAASPSPSSSHASFAGSAAASTLSYKPTLSRSHSDIAAQAGSYDQVALYKSYARDTGRRDAPYEAFVRGWVYHPHSNRKGKLMIAAVERLVGNPGKYSSIADAAAAHVADNVGTSAEPATSSVPVPDDLKRDLNRDPNRDSNRGENSSDSSNLEHARPPSSTPSPASPASLSPAPPRSESMSSMAATVTSWMHGGSSHGTSHASTAHSSTANSHLYQHTGPGSRAGSPPNLSASASWSSFRPPMFRSRSSKTSLKAYSAPGSPSESAAPSANNSTNNSTNNSANNSTNNSASNSATNSAASSAANTAPNSPQMGYVPDGDIPPITSAKRPGMRRPATFTFDSNQFQSSSTAKPHKPPSSSHLARKEQKHTIRERMAAISHKSSAMRDVRLVVESAPDAAGHTIKRSFWTTTDESGRFCKDCCVPFKPVAVRAYSGDAVRVMPLIFVPYSGISVISDIDDTVRHTGVTRSKRELSQNVLAKSFDDVRLDGVANWYNRMAEAGAHFHYVSNSPWQLYDVISGFSRHHSFPEGSIHLKKYAGVFDGSTEPVKGRKRASLEKIFRDFPSHKFILIGDSGEADLEAYAEVARNFPDQVSAIYIRDISSAADEPLSIHYRERHSRHRPYHSVDLAANSRAPPSYTHAPPSYTHAPPTYTHTTSVTPSKPPTLPPRVRSSVHNPVGTGNESEEPPESPPRNARRASEVSRASESSHDDVANMSSDSAPSPGSAASPGSAPSPGSAQSPRSASSSNLDVPASPPEKLGFERETILPASLSAQHSEPSFKTVVDSPPEKEGSRGIPQAGSPEIPEIPPRSSSHDNTASKSSSTRSEAKQHSQDPPKSPTRPKSSRRTSSKIMEGLNSVANVSSHAASRSLGPQSPPRPNKMGANPTRDAAPPGRSLRPSPVNIKHANTVGETADFQRYARSSSSPHDRPPSTISDISQPHSEFESEFDPVFVPSTQEIFDYERVVDKRSDHWKARVAKQQRSLPRSVSLKMWRAPADVEPDSISIIKKCASETARRKNE